MRKEYFGMKNLTNSTWKTFSFIKFNSGNFVKKYHPSTYKNRIIENSVGKNYIKSLG